MKLHPSVSNKKALESFSTLEERFKQIHGDKYDYVKAIYKNNTFKIEIICKEHRQSFWQTPISHLEGSGCPLCARDKKRLSLEDFIERANKKHGSKYNYSLVKFKHSNEKTTIICPEHGEFNQKPDTHLSGAGCPACANVNSPTTEDFLKKATEVHGDRYDYSQSMYLNAGTKISVICKIHGVFMQIPRVHLRGSGCPKCNLGRPKSVIDKKSEI